MRKIIKKLKRCLAVALFCFAFGGVNIDVGSVAEGFQGFVIINCSASENVR